LNTAYPHPALFRKSLAVLFDDESLFKRRVGHIHDKGGFPCSFFGFPLELRDLGAIRERLAVARNTGLICLDHRRIGDNHLEHFVGPCGRDHRPSPRIPGSRRTRFPLGDFSKYLSLSWTLRVNGRGAEDGPALAVAVAMVSLAIARHAFFARHAFCPSWLILFLNQDFDFGSWIGHKHTTPEFLILRSRVPQGRERTFAKLNPGAKKYPRPDASF